jgi:vanillate O-demethylase monooxygenase subunit
MKFLRNAWYCVGIGSDLPDGKLTHIKVLGENVLLYRRGSGEVSAIGDTCPHRFAPLHQGKLVDGVVQCPYHGLRFDQTGQCVHNPHGNGTIPKSAKVPCWVAVEKYGIIWLWMGDKEKADVAEIPDFQQVAPRDGWATIHGHLNVAAHYELLTDNLMDLSHVPFLHPFLSFSGPLPEGFREKRDLVQNGDTVWSMLSTFKTPMTPLFKMLWDEAPATGQMQMDMRWDAPANLLLEGGMFPDEGPKSVGVAIPTAHLLTPETENSTHYFWVQARNAKTDDRALDQQLWHGVDEVFRTQDEAMVIACQERMGTNDLMSLKPVLLAGDGPAVRARRVLAARVEAEAEKEAIF